MLKTQQVNIFAIEDFNMAIIFTDVDRKNITHFLDIKKINSEYQNPDGSPSCLIGKITDGAGDCVVFRNGNLYAAPCDEPAYFVCEYEYK